MNTTHETTQAWLMVRGAEDAVRITIGWQYPGGTTESIEVELTPAETRAYALRMIQLADLAEGAEGADR